MDEHQLGGRGYAVLPDFTSQCRQGDSEDLGHPRPIPSQLTEGVLDMFLFHAVQGGGR